MKKRFKVYWTEKHSLWVDAYNEEEAKEEALTNDPSESCDDQQVDHVQESDIEPEYDQMAGDR